jgi:hypothetical protein
MSLGENKVTFETKPEYMDLFKKNDQNKLKPDVEYSKKNRNAIATLNFDSGKYCLIIYKIPTSNFNLNKIQIKKENGKLFSSGVIYNVVNQSYFDFNYASGDPGIANSIQFAYVGNSLRTTIANDTIVLNYLRYQKIALKYNNENKVDMYSEVAQIYSLVPVSILFLKRNKQLYMILMSVNNPKKDLDPMLLYSMIR